MLRSVMFVVLSLFLMPVMAAPVDINTASAKELSKNLSGIGLKKAEAIVNYREKHGKYHDVKDLALVKGIGVKTVEKNKKDILLGKHKHEEGLSH